MSPPVDQAAMDDLVERLAAALPQIPVEELVTRLLRLIDPTAAVIGEHIDESEPTETETS